MKDRAKVFSFLITFAVESELIIDRGWMEDGDNKELMNIFFEMKVIKARQLEKRRLKFR